MAAPAVERFNVEACSSTWTIPTREPPANLMNANDMRADEVQS
jgi:hypothetical protein